MSNNNQNQAMQRFFEFVFNVPGDCFCCTWSISCFLETVEHMEGDKRWRSICTIGMSLLSLIIVFLLTLALCPKFYWSEINQIVMFNSTQNYPHINYSSSTYIPTMYLNSTELNSSLLTEATNALLQSPINDIQSDSDLVHDYNDDDEYTPYNITKHCVTYQHIGLHLNLWHINYCLKNYSNSTYFKIYLNNTNVLSIRNSNSLKGRIFINNTNIISNETCSFITYRESGTTSSTQDLSLWFIIFVIALLLLGCCCVLGTHPIFDICHRKNTTLRSSIQKILAIAITILCACILNWSSFVFAAVFENQVEKYQAWQQKEPITQSNLGTGMLAVNGAMLLGIILSVIHCGAPIRTDLNQINSNNNNQQQEINNNDNDANHADNNNNNDDDEKTDNNINLSRQQRMLLRHIPGASNSNMGNMAILTNPDSWFKSNNNNNNLLHDNNNSINNNDRNINININHDDDDNDDDNNDDNDDNDNDNNTDLNDNEFKEFEYQNMNIINNKDDKIYNANLSMKRIRKKDKKSTRDRDEKQVSLLLEDSSIDIHIDPTNNIIPKPKIMTVIQSDHDHHDIDK